MIINLKKDTKRRAHTTYNPIAVRVHDSSPKESMDILLPINQIMLMEICRTDLDWHCRNG